MSTEPPSLDVRSWDIEQFHEFLNATQKAVVEKEFQALEVQQQKSLLRRIPVAVRQAYGLPVKDADWAVLAKNAEHAWQDVPGFRGWFCSVAGYR